MNTNGYHVPVRAWLRILPLVNVYDAFKAFNGETMEEYGAVPTFDARDESSDKKGGGIFSGCVSCCLSPCGIPQGQVMNSGQPVSFRSVFIYMPYIGAFTPIYNGFEAMGGEDMNGYGLKMEEYNDNVSVER